MEPITPEAIRKFHKLIPEWEVEEVDGIPHLIREFKFRNFVEALAFTNQIGEISEAEGHHPLIELTWGRVKIEWWTHDIQGLSDNDFAMAVKTDRVFDA